MQVDFGEILFGECMVSPCAQRGARDKYERESEKIRISGILDTKFWKVITLAVDCMPSLPSSFREALPVQN